MADFGNTASRGAADRNWEPPNAAAQSGGVRQNQAATPKKPKIQPLTEALAAPAPAHVAMCAPYTGPHCTPMATSTAPDEKASASPRQQPRQSQLAQASPELEAEDIQQKVAALVSTGPSPIVGNLIVGICASALLWNGAVPKLWLASWLGVLILMLLVRYSAFRGHPTTDVAQCKRWLRGFAIGSALTGLWWGVLTLSLFLGLPPKEVSLLVMVAAGMAAGATATYAVYPAAAIGFFAPLLGLLSFYFFAQGTVDDIALGAVALLYGGILAKVVRGVSGWHREHVEANVRNRQMADELRVIADQSYAMETWFDENGQLRWASPSALRVTGYTADELLGMDKFPLSIIHPEDRELIDAGLKAAGANSSLHETEFRLIRKDGVQRWCSVVSQPATDESNNLLGFRASVRDVTENHELQEQLSDANVNLSTIAEYSYGWEVWIGPRGRLRWISPSVERITGFSADECYEMDDYPIPLLHEDDRDFVQEFLSNPERMNASRRWEFRVRRKDGGIRSCMVDSQPAFDSDGKSVGLRASITDITEIKALQDELKETAHNLSIIADYSFAWEALISMEGQLLWVNRGGERVTGYSVDELLAMGSPVGVMHEEDQDMVREIIKNRKDQTSGLEYQARIRRKDNVVRWIQVESEPAFNPDGKQVGFRSSVRDITELKELQAEVKKQTDELRIITDFSQAWELWFDNDASLKWVSPSVERITGYRPDQCYKIADFPIPTIHPDDREMISRGLKTAASKETFKEIEFRQLRKDGSIRWCAVESRPAFDADGQPVGFRASVRDISRQKSLQQELERIATTDSLTGIMNRRQFFNLGEAEVYRAARYGKPLSVTMLDVDHFKKINDTHGHGVGDECLKALARCVSSTIRRSDIFARLGGEEFVILMPETELADAAALADRLRLAIQKINVPLSAGMCHFTVSIGAAGHDGENTDLGVLLHHADEALYEAKGDGRNRVRVAHPDGALGPDMMAAE